MPIYQPTDTLKLGTLFAELILARKVLAAGGGTSGAGAILKEVQAAGGQQAADVVGPMLADADRLVRQFWEFVLDPARRVELLDAAGLQRATGLGVNDRRPLDGDDARRLNVLLDTSEVFNVVIPDDFMSGSQFSDPQWLSDVGAYIMRKCK